LGPRKKKKEKPGDPKSPLGLKGGQKPNANDGRSGWRGSPCIQSLTGKNASFAQVHQSLLQERGEKQRGIVIVTFWASRKKELALGGRRDSVGTKHKRALD